MQTEQLLTEIEKLRMINGRADEWENMEKNGWRCQKCNKPLRGSYRVKCPSCWGHEPEWGILGDIQWLGV